MPVNVKDSPLTQWLIKEKMSTLKFAKLIGCSRQTVWKVKRGIAVSPTISQKIKLVTRIKNLNLIESFLDEF